MKFRTLPLALFALSLATTLAAQKPLQWAFTSKDLGNGQYDLIFTANIQDGWATYSQFLESEDGPVPTSFTFEEGASFKLIGKAIESGDKFTKYDNVFGMNLTKFKPITGYLQFMACNEEMCLAPKTVDFKFQLTNK